MTRGTKAVALRDRGPAARLDSHASLISLKTEIKESARAGKPDLSRTHPSGSRAPMYSLPLHTPAPLMPFIGYY